MDLSKILSDIPDEGLPGIVEDKEEQVETPAVPESEKEEDEAVVEEDKPVEKPAESEEPAPSQRESYRWAEMRRQLKEERDAREVYEKRVADLEESFKSKSQDRVEIPEEFVDLFGDNPEAWKKYDALSTKKAQELIEARFAEVEKKRIEESTAEQRDQEVIQNEFELLGEKFGKDFTDPKSSERNAVLKFAMEYAPTNAQGNIDLGKAYELYKKINPDKQPSDERKKIASITTDNAPVVTERKPVQFGQAKYFDLDKILAE